MDCGGVLVKYILFISNMIFLVCGVLLIALGSYVISATGDAKAIFEGNTVQQGLPIAIVVLGCIIFLISFLGCCGAIRENNCCLSTYSVVMLLLLVAQVALVSLLWVHRAQVKIDMDKIIDNIWSNHKNDSSAMNGLQLAFNCCGKNGFTDYTLNMETIPASCCGADAQACSITSAMTVRGCKSAVNSFWDTTSTTIFYGGLGVAAVDLVAFIFGCCLANQVRNSRRRANY